jgi:ABC-type sugar transport system substrate-binding protein
VFITQAVPSGKLISAGVASAAKALGWKYKELDIALADPSTTVAAIQEAVLQLHANAILVAGVDTNEIKSTFAAAQRAGSVIIPISSVVQPGTGPVPAVIAGPEFYRISGAMIADWIAERSGGTAKVMVVGADSIPSLALTRQGFVSELKRVCPGCEVSATVQLSTDQITNNGGNDLVVSSLRRNPGVDYLYIVDGLFFDGLSSSLSAAGLGANVTIASDFGNVQNETEVLGGEEGATTGVPTEIEGWYAVDAVVRHMAGMSYPADYGVPPTQILTKDNRGSWKVDQSFQVPASYPEIFKHLWGVA